MKKLSLFAISLLLGCSLLAQTPPPSATDVLADACRLATKENKKVMIIFHASWCVWCHRMDSSMNDPVCKKLFDDRFVVRHLVVDESDNKKQLETPGGKEMMEKYNGKDVGIPYWLIFGSDGQLLTDSRIRKPGQGPEEGSICGCPATADEVAFFTGVLKKYTDLTDDQLKVIAKRFRENEK